MSKLKLKNSNTVEQELKRHAAILADCIMQELDAVYYLYSPLVYKRSFDLYNSLDIDRTVKIDVSVSGAKFSIRLSFDDGAMHQSFGGKMVNTAWLINDGWQTHGSFATVPNLGFREPTNFIENGIEKYKNSVSNPFPVKLTKGIEVTYF